MSDTNINIQDGVSRKEAGFFVLVVTLALTMCLGFYKAVVDGDFPPNVTAFMTTLTITIGAVEALPLTATRLRK